MQKNVYSWTGMYRMYGKFEQVFGVTILKVISHIFGIIFGCRLSYFLTFANTYGTNWLLLIKSTVEVNYYGIGPSTSVPSKLHCMFCTFL